MKEINVFILHWINITWHGTQLFSWLVPPCTAANNKTMQKCDMMYTWKGYDLFCLWQSAAFNKQSLHCSYDFPFLKQVAVTGKSHSKWVDTNKNKTNLKCWYMTISFLSHTLILITQKQKWHKYKSKINNIISQSLSHWQN